MKEGEIMTNINALKEFLDDKGVKPSYPRLRVLEYLVEQRNHPTAEQIYEELVKEMPTLSRTTVYNTLNLFVEEGVVIPINISSNETRYDATVMDHGHFKCSRCGMIVDFPIEVGDCGIKELSGYQVTGRFIYFKGICPDCIKQE
jgi:Fe2+ or Zn2+ uptake regulation protein